MEGIMKFGAALSFSVFILFVGLESVLANNGNVNGQVFNLLAGWAVAFAISYTAVLIVAKFWHVLSR